jgi:hypothetical protein
LRAFDLDVLARLDDHACARAASIYLQSKLGVTFQQGFIDLVKVDGADKWAYKQGVEDLVGASSLNPEGFVVMLADSASGTVLFACAVSLTYSACNLHLPLLRTLVCVVQHRKRELNWPGMPRLLGTRAATTL